MATSVPRRPEVPIAGIRVSIADGVLHIASERPLRALSSASCGGGWLTTHHIINVHVPKGYRSERPEDDLATTAAGLGVQGPFVGLMTAAYVERVGVASRMADGLTVACLATVGVTNATSAGRETPWREPETQAQGTINLVVLVDGNLAPEAMVNLVITTTEAKTLTLVERSLRTTAGELASGTSTDAVAIACTAAGPWLRYAGPATLVGDLAARCVREAMVASLQSG